MIAWINRVADRLEAFNARIRWRNEIKRELISIRADEEIARIQKAIANIQRRQGEEQLAREIAKGTYKPRGEIRFYGSSDCAKE